MVVQKSHNWLGYGLTGLAHIFIIVPSIYTLYICYLRGNSLATWHIIGFTVGCCLNMMEATLSVSGDAFLVSKVSRTGRVRIHWILHLFGVMWIGIGLVTVFIHKQRAGSAHYQSDHAIVGLTGVVLTVAAVLNGVMTLYPKSFYNFLGLGPIKIIHALIGLSASALVYAGQITGLNTWWWTGTDLARILSTIGYIIAFVLVFIKPTLSAGSRIRALFN